MRKQVWTAAALLIFALSVSACGQGGRVASGSASGESGAGEQPSGERTETEQAEESGAEAETVRGVIIDATMNYLTVQTENGEMLTAATGEAAEERPDFSGLRDGVSLGRAVLLSGRRSGERFVLLSAEDAEAKCGDADALAAAGTVLLCVRDRDLKALAGYAAFPLYVGIGGGMELTSEEEFLETYRAEQIFTPELVEAVLKTDLLKAEAADGSLVLSADGGKPNIVISLSDDGWGVSGINYKAGGADGGKE